MSKSVILALMVVLAMGLGGCGVGGQSPSDDSPSGNPSQSLHTGKTGGSLSMTVKFPDPGEASTRLIPVRTQSVEFYFVDEAQDVLYWDYATPDSPTVTMTGLPEGLAGYILAIAYPEAPATTAARGAVSTRELVLPPIYGCLAYAWTAVTVPPAGGSADITLALDSAVRYLQSDPSELVLDVSTTVYPYVTAWSEWDDLVMIDPALLVWEVLSETPGPEVSTTDVVEVTTDGTVTGMGYGTGELQVTESESGVSTSVLVTVVAGGAGLSMSGRVGDGVDPLTPVPDVTVRLVPADTTLASVEGVTDADGYFYIPDVPPGAGTLEVEPPAGSAYAGWAHPFTVPSDRSPWLDLLVVPQVIEDAVTAITVEPADAMWNQGDIVLYTATVTDSASSVYSVTPMWFATGDAGWIDQDGWFSASGAGAGEILAVVGSHAGSTSVLVTGSGPPPGAIRGLIVDALDPSIPVADVVVEVQPIEGATAATRSASARLRATKPVTTRQWPAAYSDSLGEFAFDNIPSGPSRLWITTPMGFGYTDFYVEMDVPPLDVGEAYIQITLVTQALVDSIYWIDLLPYGDATSPVMLAAGGSQQFDATVYDWSDNIVSLALTWAAIGPIGAVDPQGLFQARADLGTQTFVFGGVSAQAGPVVASSVVQVDAVATGTR